MSTSTSPQTNDSSAVREMVQDTTESISEGCKIATEHYVTEPAKDLVSLAKSYAKDKPEVAAVWAFGLGVIVGWKIKPW
ncbi:MAG: hypothetical protein HKN47_02195 [Pirellulaceae bacterium]|nr:hypothetical protein [Pirellulaceae bacterium]